ncbi:MAG TPA: replication-associated recombination protein A, partial [Thermoanaerobaculia bacterium]|nr:replication-associated recombination protein A [Thermoanaerobaculia bacterium]
VLSPLSPDDLGILLRRALEDPERGLGAATVSLTDEALASLAQLASGDARKALNLLEITVADAQEREANLVEASDVERVSQRKVLLYDKSGEEHFNLISALHKSLRDSDSDAALYWLTRMLAAGEDPLYLARRMIRFASEDVGLADPQALPQALAGWEAYHRLGSPEGELALAQVVLYLALAPKSNAVYTGYGQARRTVEERPADPVPMAIRNAPTRLMKGLGYGSGYVYAHDTEEGTAGLDCLPEAIAGTSFYEPKGEGFEAELKARRERIRALRQKAKGRRG